MAPTLWGRWTPLISVSLFSKIPYRVLAGRRNLLILYDINFRARFLAPTLACLLLCDRVEWSIMHGANVLLNCGQSRCSAVEGIIMHMKVTELFLVISAVMIGLAGSILITLVIS